MVSKAREDLPEPESPVITVKRSRGMSTLMFFRLCWRAPLTLMRSMAIAKTSHSSGLIFSEQGTRINADFKADIHGSEVESQPEFHPAWRLCVGGLAEEGRSLDPGKRPEIGVI